MLCFLLASTLRQAAGSFWIVILFFCLFLGGLMWVVVKLARRLFGKKPRLTLTRTGVTDYQLGIGEIQWADIEEAYIRSSRGNIFICLNLRNESEYVARMAPAKRFINSANKNLGFTFVVLALNGVDADSDNILAAIKSMALID